MPYKTNADLPGGVKDNLPSHAQDIWRSAFNSAASDGADDTKATKIAWGAVKNAGYGKNAEGKWVKKGHLVVAKGNRGLVFGWASVSITPDGALLTDTQDEQIPPDVLEDAMYEYVVKSRAGGEQHDGVATSDMVEMVVLSPEKVQAMLGGPVDQALITEAVVAKMRTAETPQDVIDVLKDAIGTRAWVGYKVTPGTFRKVTSGELAMFSIEGLAVEEEVA